MSGFLTMEPFPGVQARSSHAPNKARAGKAHPKRPTREGDRHGSHNRGLRQPQQFDDGQMDALVAGANSLTNLEALCEDRIAEVARRARLRASKMGWYWCHRTHCLRKKGTNQQITEALWPDPRELASAPPQPAVHLAEAKAPVEEEKKDPAPQPPAGAPPPYQAQPQAHADPDSSESEASGGEDDDVDALDIEPAGERAPHFNGALFLKGEDYSKPRAPPDGGEPPKPKLLDTHYFYLDPDGRHWRDRNGVHLMPRGRITEVRGYWAYYQGNDDPLLPNSMGVYPWRNFFVSLPRDILMGVVTQISQQVEEDMKMSFDDVAISNHIKLSVFHACVRFASSTRGVLRDVPATAGDLIPDPYYDQFTPDGIVRIMGEVALDLARNTNNRVANEWPDISGIKRLLGVATLPLGVERAIQVVMVYPRLVVMSVFIMLIASIVGFMPLSALPHSWILGVLWFLGQALQGFLALARGYTDYSLLIFLPTIIVAYFYRHDRRLLLTLVLWTAAILFCCGMLSSHTARADEAPLTRRMTWDDFWQVYLASVEYVSTVIHHAAGPFAIFVDIGGNSTTTWAWIQSIYAFAATPESRFCWQSGSTFYDGCTFSMYTLMQTLDVLRNWGIIGAMVLAGVAHTIVYFAFNHTLVYVFAIPVALNVARLCSWVVPCFVNSLSLSGASGYGFAILIVLTTLTFFYVFGSMVMLLIKWFIYIPTMFMAALIFNPVRVGASISSHLARLNRLGLETRHIRGDAPAGFGKWDQKTRGSRHSGPASTTGRSMSALLFVGKGLLLVVAALALVVLCVAFAFGAWAFVSTLRGFTTSSSPLCQGSSCQGNPSIQLLWTSFSRSVGQISRLCFQLLRPPELLPLPNGTLVFLQPID